MIRFDGKEGFIRGDLLEIVPDETDAPEATDEPAVTDAPEATDEPVVTDEPTATPEPTEDPNTYVDATSDAERIKAVQLILIQQQWMAPIGPDEEPSGVYDLETQLAVSNLQMWFTNLHDGLIEGMEWDELLYGAPADYLPEVIDGTRIDAHTLKLIMELRIPVNPNPLVTE